MTSTKLHYPVTHTCTYLNTANSGILSTALQEWRTQHDASFLLVGSEHRVQHASIFSELRKNLSSCFGTLAARVFLCPNFSFGFNTLLDGLDNQHRFLLLDEDYPSVNYPIRSRRFEHTSVPITKNLEDDILAAIERFKPSIFAFSLVQYISGIRLAPDFIQNIKGAYPKILLLADGTQFCGTAPFNFDASGLDAILSSGYKWMLGGYGNGFILLSDQLKDQLFRERKKIPLPREAFLADKDYVSFCFEPGHLDTLNFGSLNQSLQQLQLMGLENIEKATQAICSKARTALHSRGLLSTELLERTSASNIMSVQLSPAMCQKLASAKIIYSDRGAGSRFSFHFYNTLDDLDQLLAVLDGKHQV